MLFIYYNCCLQNNIIQKIIVTALDHLKCMQLIIILCFDFTIVLAVPPLQFGSLVDKPFSDDDTSFYDQSLPRESATPLNGNHCGV